MHLLPTPLSVQNVHKWLFLTKKTGGVEKAGECASDIPSMVIEIHHFSNINLHTVEERDLGRY